MRIASLPARGRRALDRWLRRARRVERRMVSIPPPDGRAPIGRALVSYILDPYLVPPGRPVPHAHTHFWESREIGAILGRLGFAVDAIHWTNRSFAPRGAYDLLVDVRLNLERLAPLVGDGCLKVMHAETGHASFYNPAQRERLTALARRRGIELAPYKLLEENRAIESADAAIVVGNAVTQATYRFAGRPLYSVPISQPVLYDWPAGKQFAACRRRFLWFGSGGLVHKGLDLVLDAFAAMPDFELAVAGPIDREPEFARAFRRELYETPNIRTLGWLDIASRRFLEVAAAHLALVYPSCSEGQNGGTVTCLHAGLLAIVTPETGVDVAPEFGRLLPRPSVESIQAATRELATLPPERLAAMSRAAWTFARTHHTRDRFRAGWTAAIGEILERFRPALAGRLAHD